MGKDGKTTVAAKWGLIAHFKCPTFALGNSRQVLSGVRVVVCFLRKYIGPFASIRTSGAPMVLGVQNSSKRFLIALVSGLLTLNENTRTL